MSEVDYEVTTSDNDLGDAPELEPALLILPEWPNKRGKATAFVMKGMSTGEYDEHEKSDKEYDQFGNLVRINHDIKKYDYLARCTYNGDNQRIWATAEACKKRLVPLGFLITRKMVAKADEVNYGTASSAEDAVKDAEGKSEETSSDS